MSSLWTRRWDSFVDQPYVTHVETIFYGFDGVMTVMGQIWVEGQCHNKDTMICRLEDQ